MLIKLTLCSAIVLICGYNINTNSPFAVTNGHWFGSNSYLGYSVLLAKLNNTQSWFIVGAPNGPPDIGLLYICLIEDHIKCGLDLPNTHEDEKGFIERLGMGIIIRKKYGKLGSAMSWDKSTDIITVCAPRTMITIMNEFENPKPESMHGICYNMNFSYRSYSARPSMEIEDRNLDFYNFTTRLWYNPLHGFSIHYASVPGNGSRNLGSHRIIGEPTHDAYGKLDVMHANRRISVSLPNGDDLSQFGYSVSGGCFFKKDELLYASGAPGWRYIGQVAIVNPMESTPIVAHVQGSEVGEFFGASLASGDVNNDGLDDLLVGAPHSGNDNGKVYLHFGSPKKRFERVLSLRGSADGGCFGYSVACGDLDADGFADIIVGAPWEDGGVVYIYNGGPDISERSTLEVSQRISPIEFQHRYNRSAESPGPIEGFGFSLAEPVDVDGNGYADIAVGAYKSQDAMLFFAKPIVTTQLTLEFIPRILQRNAKIFMIKACSKYRGYRLKSTAEYKISFTLDEIHRRTKDSLLELRSSETTDSCVYANVTISDHVRDFIEPIAVVARHDFLYENVTTPFHAFSKSPIPKNIPIENKNNKLNVVQEFLTFDVGCGEDNVCSAYIEANATFHGVKNNDTWPIGSDGMSLEVRLENFGEPAYLTNLVFTLPEGIVLRSILPSCQEGESGSSSVVICDVGNPLGHGEKKTVKLDLDMRHLCNGTMHGSELKFLASINSRSSNNGTKEIEKVLNLVSQVSLSLNGQANDGSYYLPAIKEELVNISFQQVYQIYKLGVSPIEEARLIVKVPTAINNGETLVHVYKIQLFVSGEVYSCLSDDTPLLHEITHSRLEGKTTQSYNADVRSLRKSDTDRPFLAVGLQAMTETNEMTDPSYTSKAIYFNCTSPNVTCSTIVCDLNSLKTSDVGKILLNLVLDTEALKSWLTGDAKNLRVSSEARVEVLVPDKSIAVVGARSRMNVTTTFYSVPKFKELQLWVVILSVSVGLVLLLIIVVVLSVMGFFKRSSKKELSALKDKGVSLKDVKEITPEEEPFWSSDENVYEELN